MGDKQKRSIVPPSYKKIKQRTDRVLVKRERENIRSNGFFENMGGKYNKKKKGTKKKEKVQCVMDQKQGVVYCSA